jgi:transcriptional antiterminator RfaH
MAFWCCARTELRREATASHFLALSGFTTYTPKLRELRARNGWKVERVVPLFPSYIFVEITDGWWDARWCVGVLSLIMAGDRPAPVADSIIDEIRSRERNGAVTLPRRSGLRIGEPIKVSGGLFAGHLGLYAGQRAHERVLVLLSLLGGQQRVILSRRDIESVGR